MIVTIVTSLLLCFQCNVDVDELHEFHLSKCDIDYSLEEESLQISLSLFIDDLELTLSGMGFDSLSICTQKESSQAENIMLGYIQQHLKITVDDNPQELIWIGKEISEDLAAVWSYLEIRNVRPEKSIVVENDLLFSSFDDQQNIVKLVLDKKRKSFFLFNNNDFKGRLDL